VNDHVVKHLKKAFWLYLYLLIFEGALRKWVLPGLAEPLLIIRDPLAIWILFKAIQTNVWRPNIYVNLIWGLTALSFIVTLLVGHGSIPVAVYGLRITLLHFPLIFVFGKIMNQEDVLKIGKVMLWLTIGMTILVTMQFFSPQSAFVNRGVGGDTGGSGFGEVSGFYRVPGTFSFTNGLSLFYGLAAAYIFYYWLGEKSEKISRILLIAATISLVIAIPLTISRTVLFQTVLTLLFLIAVSGKNSGAIKKFFLIAIVAVMLVFVLQSFDFFQTATTVFSERLTTANKVEGGLEGTIIDRFLGGMYSAIIDPANSYWGLGLGLGSKVASRLLTGSAAAYLLPEGEWGRVIGEMGFILGLLFIVIRVSLAFDLFKKAWASISLGNSLPWLLCSFGILIILQGQWSQPTALGFSVFSGGLIIAAFNRKKI